MDSSQILQAVADFGALGIASAAIFWIFIKTSKRLDDLTDSFQAQLREQAEECNKREGAVRDRYDEVVRKYDEERLAWTTRLDGIEKELKDVEDLLKEGLGEIRTQYSKISGRLGGRN
jgi:uncharacterized phage infection (PIP) family protein YhgE